MALRSNHYDRAFEEFLRARRIAYVSVDEQRRALLEQASLKSMDFIVYAAGRQNLLVDVKGRKFPSGDVEAGRGHKWENWATAEDIPALLAWQEVFGSHFRALLVFAYDVGPAHRGTFEDLFVWKGRDYAFFGVWADEYRDAMKVRSPRWETVSLPSREFARLRWPIRSVLPTPEPLASAG
jgi:hypothetical protein